MAKGAGQAGQVGGWGYVREASIVLAISIWGFLGARVVGAPSSVFCIETLSSSWGG